MSNYLSLCFFLLFSQGCGSGSGLDPDSETLWIRIRIGNPDPGARKLRKFSGKMHFLVFFLNLPLKSYKIALTTLLTTKFFFDELLTQILISKKFEKEIVFESPVLAWIRIRFWIRSRIEQKCWIRIRITGKSIRIHNPVFSSY
jgi:hypothetical protein